VDDELIAEAIVSGAKAYIDAVVAPLLLRIATLEARPVSVVKDGIGIQSAMRDADGALTLIRSDGTVMVVGQINGRDGVDGKDGADGRDAPLPEGIATVDEMRGLIAAEIEAKFAALPPPRDGIDGKDGADGRDGALPDGTATVDEMRELIAAGIEARFADISWPRDGVDGKDGHDGADADPVQIRAMVVEAVAAVPPPQDGHSPTEAEIEPLVSKAVQSAVAAIPVPKDGVGVAGAIISREGTLVLTLSDGTIRALGPVVGRDVDMAQVERQIDEAIAQIPKPKDGRDGIDGLGFEDLTVVHDGERQFTVRFARGEQVREFPFVIPALLDRGVWRDGAYAKGDVVTFGGSSWIAQADTTGKPELSPDWRLSTKRGRDGKDGTAGKPGERGPEGKPGRDGRTW
jgi:hypothetical protein